MCERPQLNELVREVITERYYIADKSMFVTEKPQWVDWPTEDGWWWQKTAGSLFMVYVYQQQTLMNYCGVFMAEPRVKLKKENNRNSGWRKANAPDIN